MICLYISFTIFNVKIYFESFILFTDKNIFVQFIFFLLIFIPSLGFLIKKAGELGKCIF